MKKIIVAINFDKMRGRGFKIIERIINYPNVSEIVLFGNNIELPPIQSSQELPITNMETEVDIPLDRVWRQIISFVHQSHLEGKLIIFDGSDELPMAGGFLGKVTPGIILKSNCTDPKVDRSKLDVIDLINQTYPMGFDLVLDLEYAKQALTSRNLSDFISHFVGLGFNILEDKYAISAYIPEVIYRSDKYMTDLIKAAEFPERYHKILKYLITKSDKDDTNSDDK